MELLEESMLFSIVLPLRSASGVTRLAFFCYTILGPLLSDSELLTDVFELLLPSPFSEDEEASFSSCCSSLMGTTPSIILTLICF
jgi:hypothetical protein